MHNIVIVGAGQLGSRHLQSLANVALQLNIDIVDPSVESLAMAVDLFNLSLSQSNHTIKSHISLDTIKSNKIDIAIIATNSLVRRRVIEELTDKCEVKHLVLEKFLFPQIEDYNVIAKILSSKKINAWVNCPRRMFDFYKNIKSEMKDSSVISFTGGLWGLGCNGIHMLDLIAFLTDEDDFILNPDLLNDKLLESKRNGYIEFAGKIIGYTKSKRHTFTLASNAMVDEPFTISIITGGNTHVIFEAAKKQVSFYPNSSQTIKERSLNVPFQSQLTNLVVEQLLNLGTCELTTYTESSKLHLQYLEMLLAFMQKQSGVKTEKCMIT